MRIRSRGRALSSAGCAQILILSACSPGQDQRPADVARRDTGARPLDRSPTARQPLPTQPGLARPTLLAMDTTGAVQRLVLDPARPAGVFAASVNGGIFKTEDYTTVLSALPVRTSWVTTTDQLPSLTVGDLAVDPTDARHLVAGGGCTTSGAPCGTEGFIHSTYDGGASWTTTSDPLLLGRRIRAVTARGETVLVATGGDAGSANSGGGIFRRTPDVGGFETRAGQRGLPATLGAVYDLVPDPLNDTGYYAVIATDGSGAGGVYRTSDAGTSWVRISDTDARPRGLNDVLNQYCRPVVAGERARHVVTNARLATAPSGELFVAVATLGQIESLAYTADQGASWKSMDVPSVLAGASGAGLPVGRITRKAGTKRLILDCGTPHALAPGHHVRLTGVPAFGPAAEDLNGDWRIEIVSPSEVALIDRHSGSEGTGSTSPGDVSAETGTWTGWEGANLGSQAHVHLALAVDPTTPSRLYLGGDAGGIFVARGSTTAASGRIPSLQWSSLVGSATASGTSPHPDVRDLAVDGAGRLLAATDGGGYLRTAPTSHDGDWYSLAGDMNTAEMLTVAMDPVSKAILGGLQDNGTPATDEPMNGTSRGRSRSAAADGRGVAAVAAGILHPDTQRELSYRYTTWQGEDDYRRYVFDSHGTIVPPPASPSEGPASPFVRLDLRDTATGKPLRDIDDISWMETLVTNHFDPERLLIGGHERGIWESRDRGETVTLVPGSPMSATSIAAGSFAHVEAMWAVGAPAPGSDRRVYQRLTAGALREVTAFPGRHPYAVVMSPTDPLVAFVAGADGRVFTTADGGHAWSDVTGDLAQTADGYQKGSSFLRDIIYVAGAASGERIVVGAASGVLGVYTMALTSPGVWTRLGANLPRAPVTALDYDEATDTLVVSTSGRGAWTIGAVTRSDQATQAPDRQASWATDAVCQAHGPFHAESIRDDGFDLELQVESKVAPCRGRGDTCEAHCRPDDGASRAICRSAWN